MLEPDGTVRMAYVQYGEWLDGVSKEFMIRKNDQADMMFKRLGITFTVYGDDSSTERMIPFILFRALLTQISGIIFPAVLSSVSMR